MSAFNLPGNQTFSTLISVLGKGEIQIGLFDPFHQLPLVLSNIKVNSDEGSIQQVLNVERTGEKDIFVVLKMDKKIIILGFMNGKNVSKREFPIESYEFLNLDQSIFAFQMVAKNNNTVDFLIDSTKINAQNYTHFSKKENLSYHLPSNCLTQNALFFQEKVVVPIICKVFDQTSFHLHYVD
jgi:hypothetical protein